MALNLKLELALDSDGDVIYITDKTAVYEAANNLGGWGAPNKELNQTALALLVELVRDETTNPAFAGTDQYVYDNIAANTKETMWQIRRELDGRYKFWIFALRVSSDGTTYIDDASAIPNDDFYFYNNQLYQMIANVPTIHTGTLADLKDIVNYEQAYTEDFFQPGIQICLWTKYSEYLASIPVSDCNSEKLLDEFLTGFANFMGADYAYRCNLTSEAQSILEANTKKLCK